MTDTKITQNVLILLACVCFLGLCVTCGKGRSDDSHFYQNPSDGRVIRVGGSGGGMEYGAQIVAMAAFGILGVGFVTGAIILQTKSEKNQQRKIMSQFEKERLIREERSLGILPGESDEELLKRQDETIEKVYGAIPEYAEDQKKQFRKRLEQFRKEKAGYDGDVEQS